MEPEALTSLYSGVHDGQPELEDVCDEVAQLDLEEIERETDTCMLIDEGSETQIVKTKLRLCSNEYCEGCDNLHLCKLLLFGECPYNNKRETCQFSHDFYSEHNIGVLCQHRLLELDLNELCITLLQNDTSLLPPVCLAYNEGSGEFGNCLEAETCKKLHVCENYIRGTCEASAACSRCHDLYEPHPAKILQDNGVSNQLMGILLAIYKNMFTITDVSRSRIISSALAPEEMICLFNLENSCDLENACENVHFYLPYKWEQRDGNSWKVLLDNEEVERAYCNPNKTHSDGSIPVNFDTMTQGIVAVRRLSTISSVLDPSFAFTTKWIWYWEDEHGNWIQYGSPQGTHSISSITSEFLEWKYIENNSAVIKFVTDQHSYEVNIQDMMQYNKQMNTKIQLRRRPMFLSAEDVQKVIRELESRDQSHNPQAFPTDTDKANISLTGFKRVLLDSDSDEYRKISEHFCQTMSEFNVKSIEKVLNEDLWEVFQRHINVMKQKNVDKENEKLLFHGTESKKMDAICQQGIDWRIYGAHEIAYGKGGYFTRDAKSSHSYTDKSGNYCMFLCRVFVGEYTNGHPSYIHPPLKDGQNGIFYDSCVNDLNKPSIFVVFEKHQVYPEYLIQYEQGAGSSPVHGSINQFSLSSQASFSDPPVSGQFQFYNSNPTSVPFTAPQFHFSPTVHSPFFAHSDGFIFQRGAARVPFPTIHYYKPAIVRKFTVSNPKRPQIHHGSHGSFRSIHSPASILAHARTSALVKKYTCSTSVSSDSKISDSGKAQKVRHQDSNPTKSKVSPRTASASTAPHTDVSKPVRSEDTRAKRAFSQSSGPRNRTDKESTKPAGKSSNDSVSKCTKPVGRTSESSASQSAKSAGKNLKGSPSQSTKSAGKSSESSHSQSAKSAGKSSESSHSQSAKSAGKSSESSHSQSAKSAGKSSESSHSQSAKSAGKSSESSHSQSTKSACKSSESSHSQSAKSAGKNFKSSHSQSAKSAGKNFKSSHSQSAKSAGNFKSSASKGSKPAGKSPKSSM